MSRYFRQAGIATMWCLAFVVALTSTRYFFAPPPLMLRTETLAFSRHQVLIQLHIVGGIAATAVGLFQFVSALRSAYPRLHRLMGYLYLISVALAGGTGLWLSPDTPIFAADGLTDLAAIDLSGLGLSPTFLGYSATLKFSPNQFFLVRAGFTILALVWLLTSLLAFVRARQRCFASHRAWMVRNYSLTFAAATVRLVGLPLLIVTRNPIFAITCTFWSWVLNLGVAEWVISHKFRARG
jgi:hypothetical protein